MLPFAVLLITSAANATNDQSKCAREINASSVAIRLSELPPAVVEEMNRLKELFGTEMADSDAPLLRTDAPTAAEKLHVQARFAQAYQVRDVWFVQFEISMFAGVRTTSFKRQANGRYSFQPMHYFGGPPCTSIKAALNGVIVPLGPRTGL